MLNKGKPSDDDLKIIQKRPKKIPKKDIGRDGYILSKEERTFALSYLSDDKPLLKKNEKYPVPEGHPLHNKIIPFDIIKDTNGGVFVIHDGAYLGGGTYGALHVAQAINDVGRAVKAGDYIAVKSQKIGVGQTEAQVKKEIEIDEIMKNGFGGGRVIKDDQDTTYYYAMHLLKGQDLSNCGLYIGFEDEPEASEDIHLLFEEKTETTSLPPTPRTPKRTVTPRTPRIDPPPMSSVIIRQELPNEIFRITTPRPSSPKLTPQVSPRATESLGLVTLQGDIESIKVDYFLKLFVNIAEKVAQMHENGIIHLDLKPANLMVDEAGNVTIIDFGLSKKMSEVEGQMPYKHAEGTGMFIPPEMFNRAYKENISTAQDIYSMARTCELLIYHGITYIAGEQSYTERMPAPYCPYLPFIRSHFLTDFTLKNDLQDPRVDALNEMLALIRSSRDLDPAKRPSAKEFKEKLQAIQHRLDQRNLLQGQVKDVKTPITQNKEVVIAQTKWQNMIKGDYKLNLKIKKELAIEIKNLKKSLKTAKDPEKVSALKVKIANKEQQLLHVKNEIRIYKEKHPLVAPQLPQSTHHPLMLSSTGHIVEHDKVIPPTTSPPNTKKSDPKNEVIKKIGDLMYAITQYKKEAQIALDKQNSTMLGNVLLQFGKVDQNKKVDLCNEVLQKLDDLRKNARLDSVSSTDMEKDLKAICSEAIRKNEKIHKGEGRLHQIFSELQSTSSQPKDTDNKHLHH